MTQKREELQHMEVKLRAQITAGSELMQVQNNFDAQIKEKANANVKLQVLLFSLRFLQLIFVHVYLDKVLDIFLYLWHFDTLLCNVYIMVF